MGRAACLVAVAAAASAASVATASSATVNIDWGTTLRTLRTSPTLQVVANPLLDRNWNTSATMFQQLSLLYNRSQPPKNLGPIRYVPWFPYMKYAVPELEPPSGPNVCAFTNAANDDYHAANPVRLSCEGAGYIASVDFVNYGTQAGGFCSNLTQSSCSYAPALPLVQQLCVGKVDCDLFAMDTFFSSTGVDPCPNQMKTLAVRAQCSDASVNHITWDARKADEMMEDFMVATGNLPDGTKGADVVINFSTEPYWIFDNGGSRVLYQDDPLAESGGPPGSVLVDSTAEQLGRYYGRLVSWYTQGGFTDEYGAFHASPWRYNISHWEVLNELEHGLVPDSSYLTIYDKIVNHIIDDANFTGKFVALALGYGLDPGTLAFFTNASNHNPPSTPVDYLSWHHYPGCADNSDVQSCSAVFGAADQIAQEMAANAAQRDAVAPSVKLSIDELGIFTGLYPIPDSYWNVAAAFHAYVYGQAALVGMDIIGASQLVGSPAFPNTPVGWQYPEVSMVDWTTGLGTARLWGVKLIAEQTELGSAIVNATVPFVPTPTNPFCGEAPNLASLTLACADPGATINAIEFASYGTVVGSCGNYSVGTCNAANSTQIVESYCLNQNSCTIPTTTAVFGDPCYDTFKYLKVQATCSTGGGYQSNGTSPLFALAYITPSDNQRRVLLVNKASSPIDAVTVPGATGGTMSIVDAASGYAPARTVPVVNDTFSLDTWAVAVLTMPPSAAEE